MPARPTSATSSRSTTTLRHLPRRVPGSTGSGPPEPRPHHVTHLAAVSRLSLWADGRRVDVERRAPHRADPAHAQIVFLHGWGMSHAGYRTGLSLMAVAGARVDAYALPGYAGSDPLPARACGLADHARCVGAAVEQAAYAQPVHLVGHSFGGGVALALAAARPDLVTRVTAVCPVGGAAGGRAPWPSLLRGFLGDGGTAGLASFARSFAPAARRSPLTLAATGVAARRADLTAELRQAKAHGIDVHLVLADRDAVVPPGPMVHPSFGARLSMVAGGHGWPHQDPRGWADLTLATPGRSSAPPATRRRPGGSPAAPRTPVAGSAGTPATGPTWGP